MRGEHYGSYRPGPDGETLEQLATRVFTVLRQRRSRSLTDISARVGREPLDVAVALLWLQDNDRARFTWRSPNPNRWPLETNRYVRGTFQEGGVDLTW